MSVTWEFVKDEIPDEGKVPRDSTGASWAHLNQMAMTASSWTPSSAQKYMGLMWSRLFLLSGISTFEAACLLSLWA